MGAIFLLEIFELYIKFRSSLAQAAHAHVEMTPRLMTTYTKLKVESNLYFGSY